ncbi:hypothetical protein GCM10023212_21940 [Luteolibacter yonseiensis]
MVAGAAPPLQLEPVVQGAGPVTLQVASAAWEVWIAAHESTITEGRNKEERNLKKAAEADNFME